MTVFWWCALAGAAAGATEAWSIARSIGSGARPWSMFARLLAVGTVLALAARAGQLAAAGAAWALAFTFTLVVFYRRLT